MNKIDCRAVTATLFALVALCYLGIGSASISIAQVPDEGRQNLLERDKNVPQEKVDMAFAEAQRIQEDIIEIMAKEKPKYKLKNKRASHLISMPPGERGSTVNEISWQNGKQKNLFLVINLRLAKKGMSEDFWRSLDFISMGDFIKVREVGDEAVLVKNVYANTALTDVGLHFIKGRAKVYTRYRNRKEKTDKNEKELRELVSLIEPLVVARDNFDDE